MNEAIGLAALFGVDQWVSAGLPRPTRATKSEFEALLFNGRIYAGEKCNELLSLIPHGVRNTFVAEPRTQYGFKFDWIDTEGIPWHVHGHEPDRGAQAGHAGGQSWTVRIKCARTFLQSVPFATGIPPTFVKWTASQGGIGPSHIPLVETLR